MCGNPVINWGRCLKVENPRLTALSSRVCAFLHRFDVFHVAAISNTESVCGSRGTSSSLNQTKKT